jgi:periplasmic protein TonB
MSPTAFSLHGAGPRVIPLGLIILLHAALLYAALYGMQHPASRSVMPREVVATFITPQPAPVPEPQVSPPEPQPVPKPVPKVASKPTPVVKKAATPKVTPSPTPAPAPVEQPVAAPAPTVAAAPSTPEPPAAAPVAPAAPPAPIAPAPPKTVSGVEYVQPPQPDYPPISKRMGEEGKVMLRVLVSERGRPEKVDIQKSSGFTRLDEAARQAAMRAMFKPHLEDGKPVAVYALIPINFSIQ